MDTPSSPEPNSQEIRNDPNKPRLLPRQESSSTQMISDAASSYTESDVSEMSDSENSLVKIGKASNIQTKNNMVSFDAIVIPFGEEEVESLLSYRYNAGKEEFLVKFKYTSYHHVAWLPRDKIENDSPGNKARVKRFLELFSSDPSQFDEPINPLHLEIDRLLDEGELEDASAPGGYLVYVLVKWCGLPYESATWERIEKVKELSKELLEEFSALQEAPDDSVPVAAPIPPPSSFVKLTESPQFKGGHQLRDYQLEGLNWFTYCWHKRQSCIMADEMGLGKTIQSVSFLYHIHRTFQIRGPFLIVAPLSTLPHWEREVKTWTTLNAIVYHGSSISRNLIVDTEFYFKDEDGKRLTEHFKFDVLITTYEMIQSGSMHLKPLPWRVAVFDEAHRLKNRNSKILETLKSYQLEHRVLLTGTPLQNSVGELYSLLNFLQPDKFNDEKKFLEEFGNLKSEAEVSELQEILKPLMLRRFKEDVEKSLPDKEETVIEVELTSVQKTWYRAILEKNFTWLQRGQKGSGGPSLNNIMMELRKCCNHPFLIQGAEDSITQGIDDDMENDPAYLQSLVQASGKMVLLDKLLPKLREGGHKVLIFSQMTRMLDILGTYLQLRGYDSERIDGNVKSHDRQIAIDRFSSSPDSFVFLLCTRAGGVGINLTAADTVVIFDSDWNPQNDLQAMARVHRIGQTKMVKIYRLLCAKTYEREMFDRANLKLGLDKAVMQKMDLSEVSSGLSKKEVEDLLKLGAYGSLLEDGESERFCAEDIDHILARRSTVVKYDGNVKGSAFSKATFAADTNLDDPEFWDSWAKKANIDPTQTNPLIIDEPRLRKRPLLYQPIAKDPTASEDSDAAQDLPKPWSSPERLRIEKQLSIFGISNWERLKEVFPRRSIQDLQACTMTLIDFMGKAKDDEELKGQADDLLAAMPLDSAEWQRLQKTGIPYPNATPHQIAEFRSYLCDATADYQDRLVRKSRQMLKRIHTIHLICDKADPSALTPSSIDPQAPLPARWWCYQADRDFIIGTKKHGYMQFVAMQNDPSLYFSRLNFDPPSPSQGTPAGLRTILRENDLPVSWPSLTDINMRLRHILASLCQTEAPKVRPTNSQARAHNYLLDQVVALRAGVELEYEIDMDPTWSNKEHKNFSRLLSSFGLETEGEELGSWVWTRFRILGELNNKTEANLNAYIAFFISAYKDIIYGPGGDGVRDKNVDVVNFFDKLIAVTPAPTEEFNIDLPTPEKVKRVIKRIMLMHTIRHKLRPMIRSLVLSTRIPVGFPTWWAPRFDIALVEAVAFYGITREDLVFADTGFPFRHQNPADWPKEGHLIKHLETLTELLSRSKRAPRKPRATNSHLHPPAYAIEGSVESPQSSSRLTDLIVIDSAQGPILIRDPNFSQNSASQPKHFPQSHRDESPRIWVSPSPSMGLSHLQQHGLPTSPSPQPHVSAPHPTWQ
ncbi:hypothetical protein DSO57_1010496 [Entomophthora muscae]|uniref:Uncharacterized protein n=1 Tax=Entomophthora muscae TaxID=34485 RepID=A0ACC2SJK8_9FUNG|nr:hypothetical protein DSO57_1010496 [Entomophthora muscae]